MENTGADPVYKQKKRSGFGGLENLGLALHASGFGGIGNWDITMRRQPEGRA